MQVDPEWSTREDRGFSWWASRLRQRVWSEPAFRDGDLDLYRVHARTDLLTGFVGDDKSVAALSLITPFATMNSPVRDPDDPARVQLAASMYVHKETVGWTRRLFSIVVAIQVAEAERVAEAVAKAAGAEVAASAHPTTGLRAEPDDMLNVVEDVVIPLGHGRSKWGRGDFAAAARAMRKAGASVRRDSEGMVAAFKLQGLAGKLVAHAATPHPVLGHGLLFIATFPVGGADAETSRLALELNERESHTQVQHPCLGSWCPSQDGLSHVSFFPNLVHAPNLTINLALYKLNQARWAVRSGMIQSGPRPS